MKRINIIVLLLMSVVFGITSCSEKDDTVEEYPNWKASNAQYFKDLYNTTAQKISSGDTSWKILRSYNMPGDGDNTNFNVTEPYKVNIEDNIIVNVLNEGTGDTSPMFTDSVKVHYTGRLLPSTSFSDGYIFDRSYYNEYNPATMFPATMCVSSLIKGFSTALMHMHVGDRWLVYIPQQLAYGESVSGSIPAYSTLVFDITLVGYFRPWASYSAKPIGGTWIEE